MKSQLRRRLLKAASELELHYMLFFKPFLVAYGGDIVDECILTCIRKQCKGNYIIIILLTPPGMGALTSALM